MLVVVGGFAVSLFAVILAMTASGVSGRCRRSTESGSRQQLPSFIGGVDVSRLALGRQQPRKDRPKAEWLHGFVFLVRCKPPAYPLEEALKWFRKAADQGMPTLKQPWAVVTTPV